MCLFCFPLPCTDTPKLKASTSGTGSSSPSRPKSQPANEVDLEIAQMVQEKAKITLSPRKQKSEDPVVLHIWDFAGHDLYYTTHQVGKIVLMYQTYVNFIFYNNYRVWNVFEKRR